MKTETYTDKDAFLAAVQGRRAPKRAKAKGVIVREPRTGLSTMLQAGWNNEYNAQMYMRLYRGDKSTAYFDDEADAVRAARLLD